MKVMLVDDATFIRMSLRKILDSADFGFTYVDASTGTEAVSMYKREKPDLVIMDITMPEMDGITAVKEIMGIDKTAKIIMCSAVGYQEKVVDAISAGALDFIVKPYEQKKIVATVKKVLKL